jgi:putative transposase
MSEYRRNRVEGGTYFFTLVTYNRQSLLTTPVSRIILHGAFESVKKKHPFSMDAICLLPDHLHCIWTLPESDSDYSLRWKEIKRQFSHKYLDMEGVITPPNKSRQKRIEAPVWQRRFWEHTIRNELDLETHLNYIHFNPVKHGLVSKPAEWEWSSFSRYVQEGKYDKGWGDQGEISRISIMPVEFE